MIGIPDGQRINHEAPSPLSFYQESLVLGTTGQEWAGLGKRTGPTSPQRRVAGQLLGQQLASVPGAPWLCAP